LMILAKITCIINENRSMFTKNNMDHNFKCIYKLSILI
jgi:hypothetical protein